MTAIDYKAGDIETALAQACPHGVDVYFDNTAGPISDAVLPLLAIGARVVICGTASVASWDPPPMGPRVERHLLVKRARMPGLLVFDYQHRYEEAVARLADWVRDGRLRYREDIVEGIEHAPAPSPSFIAAKTSASGSSISLVERPRAGGAARQKRRGERGQGRGQFQLGSWRSRFQIAKTLVISTG